MEERLDMESERSGIVSANATVRRRRRSSKLEMVVHNCDFEKSSNMEYMPGVYG